MKLITIYTIAGLMAVLSACGQNGPKGDQGLIGAPGAVGPQGPGTTVTMVKLCPNNPPTNYPATYPEYGFCISGNLYATYSANDGFTTMIVPGTYSSNGINSSCTFVVSANCQVTQQ